MSSKKLRPRLVYADEKGNIYDHPELEMLVRRGGQITSPRPDELIPLPPESELFLLPGRTALGLDAETGLVEETGETAVAAFVCPGHTLSAQAAYATAPGAPILPLFAYGAVGFAADRFYVAATRVDLDPRQIFTGIPRARIAKGASALLRKYPQNRLVAHLSRCALTYCCPAAKNLALGRFEAPLPTSRVCNARCIGCLSLQDPDSGFPSTQNRISFTPRPEEIAQVMAEHGRREVRPIFSFGQGCEGEPLTEAQTIAKGVSLFRQGGGTGTVNVNTNGSLPDAVAPLAAAGVDSVRVSLSSGDERMYAAYYRPKGYAFSDVREFMTRAKAAGLFLSVNLLYFPGVTDTEAEYAALAGLLGDTGADFVQMRNLNLDPELYLSVVRESGARTEAELAACMGLGNFMKRLSEDCPGLRFGYFNPALPLRPGTDAA
ncbi:radical SAM protein [Desulfovibrio sulfodismutans]|uniref:Radical SAM protein n=1 Tax=Desulfolutivibrio sulfodismutans TaxID=63561 RepID=A0A7K3NNB8_9BACT|nr:radical SAM protein [Desulfolutivibrio sulfodismutans]NDY57681.1 radical SAM protein [Desulfolutivibrio sulfodismutans]QLA12267.1 radical SAM protein [Desulfolutivibrio sulfodismutans DSM 3696]